MAVLLLTNLVSFRSRCEVVTLCTWPPSKRRIVYVQPTMYRPEVSRSAQSRSAYNGLHLPHSRTNTLTSRKAEHEQRVKARVKSTCCTTAFLPEPLGQSNWAQWRWHTPTRRDDPRAMMSFFLQNRFSAPPVPPLWVWTTSATATATTSSTTTNATTTNATTANATTTNANTTSTTTTSATTATATTTGDLWCQYCR